MSRKFQKFTIILLFLLLRLSSARKDMGKCAICAFFVETFNKGLLETVKSHFAGGNTAWESKLGKYSRSETRLVEILDTFVCQKSHSKNDDVDKDNESRCHSLVEAYEEDLENWYFHKQEAYPDLYEWLCIKRLLLCCPANTWGPTCSPCAGEDPERPCWGRGKCDGAGTREGTGRCKCDRGYTGKLCRKCAEKFFASEKNDTHITCEECHTSCKTGCNGPKADDCENQECRDGWSWNDEAGCTDIDECQETPCSKEHEKCTNTEGSYVCICEKGFKRENQQCVPEEVLEEDKDDDDDDDDGDDDENDDTISDENNVEDKQDDDDQQFEEALEKKIDEFKQEL